MWGMLWTTTIYVRSATISGWWQKPVLSSSGVSSPGASQSDEIFRRLRSPHAKNYHLILFHALVLFELFCGICFMLSGLMLIRRYPFGRSFTLYVLYMDIFFKMMVAWYMQYCAVPLEFLTHNANVLNVYYFPNASFWSRLSGYFSGLKMASLYGVVYLLVYILIFFLSFYYLTSTDVVKQFLRRKKAKNRQDKEV